MINLLPEKLKHTRTPGNDKLKIIIAMAVSTLQKAFSPSLLPFVLPGIAIIFMAICVRIGFNIQIANKTHTIEVLDKKIVTLKSGDQEITGLKKKKNELIETSAFYGNIFKDWSNWTEKLYLINKYLPAQVWLTSISSQNRPDSILTIKGSIASLFETEIISSITTFTTKLKEDAAFSKDLNDLKLGSLQSEVKGKFICMNFSLTCRFVSETTK